LATYSSDHWALVLGGSSGFGLATAQRLAQHGMNVCIVHRDRRAVLKGVEPEFEKIRGSGVQLLTFNKDALDSEKRTEVLDELATALGSDGRVRVLLHSIAFGNLKLIAPERARPGAGPDPRLALAEKLGVDADALGAAVDELFALFAQQEWIPPHFGMTDRKRRNLATFTIFPLMSLITWGKRRSPQFFRERYYDIGPVFFREFIGAFWTEGLRSLRVWYRTVREAHRTRGST